jgi:hypothetical protein
MGLPSGGGGVKEGVVLVLAAAEVIGGKEGGAALEKDCAKAEDDGEDDGAGSGPWVGHWDYSLLERAGMFNGFAEAEEVGGGVGLLPEMDQPPW